MLTSGKCKIVIEYCVDNHWSTNYNIPKYKEFVEHLKNDLSEHCPDADVIENKIPAGWKNYKVYQGTTLSKEQSPDFEGCINFTPPRRGAFEVTTVMD